jgi:CCR4-NOT transcription complex subunit 1
MHAILSAALGSSTASETSDGGEKTFNVELIVDALKEAVPGLSWSRGVEKYLDSEKFLLKDKRGFLALVGGIRRGLEGGEFPLDSLMSQGVWKNMSGQLSFLAHAVSAPPEVNSRHALSRQLHLLVRQGFMFIYYSGNSNLFCFSAG